MSGASLFRTFGLLAFIVAVAASLYLLDARPVYVVLGVGLAWTLAATYEWLAWRHRARWAAAGAARLPVGDGCAYALGRTASGSARGVGSAVRSVRERIR